jgi:transcriptional regulator with XRE-family HTH domain
MGDRLKRLCKEIGLNQAEFAKRITLKQGTYCDIENGKKNLTERNIKIICTEFGINENWLKYGTGEKFANGEYENENHLTQDETELLDIYQKLSPPIKKDVFKYARNMLDLQKLREKIATPEKEAEPEIAPEPEPEAPQASPEPPQDAEILPYPEHESGEKRETPRTGPRLEDAPVG